MMLHTLQNILMTNFTIEWIQDGKCLAISVSTTPGCKLLTVTPVKTLNKMSCIELHREKGSNWKLVFGKYKRCYCLSHLAQKCPVFYETVLSFLTSCSSNIFGMSVRLHHGCTRVAHCVTAQWRNFSHYCRPLSQYDVWFTCSEHREALAGALTAQSLHKQAFTVQGQST